ncbi:hypothetical protein J6A31_04985 [bacterium]|nr:hypothetical protein [bacterium]
MERLNIAPDKICGLGQVGIEPATCTRVIDYVRPEGVVVGEDAIVFLDDNKLSHINLNVQDTQLPLRIKNSLCRLGLFTLRDVVFCNEDCIRGHNNIGEKSFNELIVHLKSICVLDKTKSAQFIVFYKLVKRLRSDMLRLKSDKVSYLHIDSVLRKNLSLVRSKIEEKQSIADLIKDKDIANLLYSDEVINSAVEERILSAIRSDDKTGLSKDELCVKLPRSFLHLNKLDSILCKFIREGIVSVQNGLYVPKCESVRDFVKTLESGCRKDMFIAKLNGESTGALCSRYNTTRQTVFNNIQAILKKMPQVNENMYLYWYKTYDFTKQDFIEAFDVEEYVYNYLKLLSKRGKRPISDIRNDELASSELIEKIDAITLSHAAPTVNVQGIVVRRSCAEITLALLQQNHTDKPCSWKTVYQEYCDFCDKNNLDDLRKKRYCFESPKDDVVTRHVLTSSHHHVRYYDMSKYDFSSFFNDIDFKKYKGDLVSSSKIFNNYIDLMKQYDIQSHFELHNLIRKNKQYVPDYVTLCKMPHLKIE